MKRTNIELDEFLVGEGLKVTGLKTRKDLVNYALKELVRREKQLEVLKLKGMINWDADLSVMRKSRFA